ncbi:MULTISPECIES: hypothetical protein [Pantoea]|jgi:hypothetical protein|uniref:hypothetical protein n=1 Tax=Pantoea TaxID=53335 RepID=UPI001A925200|nr:MULTISPECIES: hypothetical protein [Pantoea]MBN1089892.1 hypothetical protein [Pantoea sp. 1B4]MBO0637311.1 hypothetical protein [Pantoea agglomerans]
MDAKQIAYGIVEGMSSIPSGMYQGVVRTWEGSGLAGSDLKNRNQRETERFMRLIKATADRHEPIRQLITIVINDFYAKLDNESKQAIDSKLGYGAGRMGGRIGSQFFLAQFIAKRILTRILTVEAFKRFVRVGSSLSLNILMVQGLIEEASVASRRMQNRFPMTYSKVSRMNLDMVYFLVERPLEPYLIYINSHRLICERIQNELCKIISS